jgi:DNA-binding response OmpR family regulator
MSLVGNLEDLSLGDLLQILSLSQKSGVLALSGDEGTGRIVFQRGLVGAAWVKGIPSNLRDLLVSEGALDPGAFDALSARARASGEDVVAVLGREAGIEPERVETLTRAAVESAVIEMFTWPSGEFCFEMQAEFESERPALLLTQPLNAQYLAMEGLRLRDERERDAALSTEGDPADPTRRPRIGRAEDPLFGEDFAEDPVLELPSDVLVGALVDQLDSHDLVGASSTASAEAEISTEPRGADFKQPGPVGAPPVPAGNTSPPVLDVPVVVIDPDVVVLDWAKAALRGRFARVHVFQQAEQGLSRIRQYLIRGQQPLVLLSLRTPIDPLTGIHGLADFVKRLKAQAPRLIVLGLRSEDEERNTPPPAALDDVLVRPTRPALTGRGGVHAADAAEALARELVQRSGFGARQFPTRKTGVPIGASKAPLSPEGLRLVTNRLQAASSYGDVVPTVLDFASTLFDRVAMLVLREERVFLVAGRGVDCLEIDPLSADASISLPVPGAGWIRSVLEDRRPVRCAPEAAADRDLLAALGGQTPSEAFLAPIESGSAVIAILYGDQALGGAPLPESQAIEVVLQYAGLALDRAVLERALAEGSA